MMTLMEDFREGRGAGLRLAVLLMVLAALFSYHNSFDGPFLHDDIPGIAENPTIRSLWPVHLTMPRMLAGTTVDGRPVTNYSFAVNYALGGLDPFGYHAVNLLIHILNALLLMAVFKRVFESPQLVGRFGKDAGTLAFFAALLWAVHPLQTESVTYIVQRAESLVTLFYLLTIYFAARSFSSADPLPWRAAAVVSCLLGMGTKEVMVTAPVMVLCYDRLFHAGSFRKAFGEKKGFCLALFATLAVLAFFMNSTGWRNKTVGFSSIIPVGDYLTTQAWALVRYLELFFRPSGLIFDYEHLLVTDPTVYLPRAALIILLASASAWAFFKGNPAGFAGIFFFAVLAPTSSFVPLTPTVVEHRAYLALAPLAALAAAFSYSLWMRTELNRNLLVAAGMTIALVLSTGTVLRNEQYRNACYLWADTVEKMPENGRARNNLASAMIRIGDHEGAEKELFAAIELSPGIPETYFNLASIAVDRERYDDALKFLKTALNLKENYHEALNLLGVIHLARGENGKAAAVLERVVRLRPDYALAHFNLGNARLKLGDPEKAVLHLRKTRELMPGLSGLPKKLAEAERALARR